MSWKGGASSRRDEGRQGVGVYLMLHGKAPALHFGQRIGTFQIYHLLS